jgi:hypothetical protein
MISTSCRVCIFGNGHPGCAAWLLSGVVGLNSDHEEDHDHVCVSAPPAEGWQEQGEVMICG